MPKKVDKNQAEIVAALRNIGASVQDLHTVGKGCPDLLVGYHGKNILLEIKTQGNHLNEREWEWFQSWNGSGTVVYDAISAVKIVQVIGCSNVTS